ncbi:hypothetical protein [Paenibacillus tyrfis]|uniref:hypothetical protein n=1 Tax=Paenibacillus tyrfis TaxID=1501230 RepID=UPI000B589FE5|nr:hypothetical protein [Paenibacillus tyrfis]
MSPVTRSAIPASILDKITASLSMSISHTFLWALIPAALTILCVLWMSREKIHISPIQQEAISEQVASHS